MLSCPFTCCCHTLLVYLLHLLLPQALLLMRSSELSEISLHPMENLYYQVNLPAVHPACCSPVAAPTGVEAPATATLATTTPAATPATLPIVSLVLSDDDDDFVNTSLPKVTKEKKEKAKNVPYTHYEDYPNKAAADKAARILAPQKTKHGNNKHQYDWKCTCSPSCTKLIRRKGA